MVSLESYELNYSIFLAEQELFDNLVNYGSGLVNESMGLISINEGVKETVINYLHKVAESIQKVWEKFKEIVNKAVNAVFLKSISKKINEVQDPGFTIIDYKNYDMTKLGTIKLIAFDYNEMKQYLSTKEAFIGHYYSDLVVSGSSLTQQIEKKVVTSKENKKCTKEILQSVYKFASTDFKSELDKIESDLRTVNSSNKNIEQIVKTVSSAETANEVALIYESYLLEEDNVKFKDDKDRESKSNNTELTKHVTIYMKASTEILSAKLKILRDVYAQSMKILRHAFGSKQKKESDKKENKPTNPNPNIQVEI